MIAGAVLGDALERVDRADADLDVGGADSFKIGFLKSGLPLSSFSKRSSPALVLRWRVMSLTAPSPWTAVLIWSVMWPCSAVRVRRPLWVVRATVKGRATTAPRAAVTAVTVNSDQRRSAMPVVVIAEGRRVRASSTAQTIPLRKIRKRPVQITASSAVANFGTGRPSVS